MSEMSMADPLGDDVGGPRALATCVKDVDGGPPGPVGGPVSVHNLKSVL
jgi:hypothetical protein